MVDFAKLFLAFVLCAFALSACSFGGKGETVNYDSFKGYYKVGKPYKIDGQWYFPKVQPDYDDVGIASWYGDKFHGKITANGAKFDKNALTAAHNTLPLPSMVRVTNLENNRTLVVMINDRGPFSKGRIIDLSEKSADILGFRDKGIAKVRVQFLPGQTRKLLSGIARADSSFKPPVESAPVASVGSVEDLKPIQTSKPLPGFLADGKHPVINIDNSVARAKSIDEVEAEREAISSVNATEPDGVVESNDVVQAGLQKSTQDTVQKVAAAAPVVTGESLYVQAGTYSLEKNAKKTQKLLSSLGKVEIKPVEVSGRTMHKVRIGPWDDTYMAKLALKKAIILGYPDAVVVKEPSYAVK